jgi:hypothetical protein
MDVRKKILMFVFVFMLTSVYGIELFTIYKINPYACEDAYITFRFSRNLSEGLGPVFNPGEHVEGYSNFLWMSCLALAGAAGLDMVAVSRLAGGVFNTLALFFVWYIPYRHFGARGFASLLAPLLYLLFLPFHFSATSGLETSLYMLLILLCLHAVLLAGNRALPFLMPSCIFLLIALTRPEGIIYFVFFCAYLLWRCCYRKEPLSPYMPGILLVIAGYGAFIIWRIGYYGLPLPNTYYAKGAFPFIVRTALGISMNKGFAMHYTYFFLFILAGLGFAKHSAGNKLVTVVLFIAAGFFFSIGFSGFDWMPFFRYTLPVVPLIIILCQVLFMKIWNTRHTHEQRLVLGCLTAFLLLLASEQFVSDLVFNLRWKQIGDFAYYNQKFIGDWFKQELGRKPLIAIGDVGRLAYFSEARILDIFGLTNREFAMLKKEHCTPDLDLQGFSVSFDSYKEKERRLLLEFAPDYVFLYSTRLKISDTFPGSVSGITEHSDFREHYNYMSSVYVIPRTTSPAWPRLHHFIDVLDLSSGLLSWIRDGWGYDIYIRKDSPHKRFTFEFYPDERIKRIVEIDKHSSGFHL